MKEALIHQTWQTNKDYRGRIIVFKITLENYGKVLICWNRNWNRNQGFRAGIGMESVGLGLESESEPESDF